MGDAISHSAESMAHGIHKRKGSKAQRHKVERSNDKGDALGFTVMFRNSDYFYFVLRQRDKQRPIFLVYSE